MLGDQYSHEVLKKATYGFRRLFDNIYVIYRGNDGETTSRVKVPIAYSQRSQMLDAIAMRLSNQSNLFQGTGIPLPSLGFEIIGMNYDPIRQLPRTNQLTLRKSEGNVKTVFARVPYNVQLQINIATRSWDELDQIRAQIQAVFNPSYTIKVKPLNDYPDVVDNYPVVLNGVSWLDDNDGKLGGRRELIDVVDFEMKIYYYSEIRDSKTIETVDTDFSLNSDPFTSFEKLVVSTEPKPVPNPTDKDSYEVTKEITSVLPSLPQ